MSATEKKTAKKEYAGLPAVSVSTLLTENRDAAAAILLRTCGGNGFVFRTNTCRERYSLDSLAQRQTNTPAVREHY